jgi:hypothetical protein
MLDAIYINTDTAITDPTPGQYIVAPGVRVTFPDDTPLSSTWQDDGSRVIVVAEPQDDEHGN